MELKSKKKPEAFQQESDSLEAARQLLDRPVVPEAEMRTAYAQLLDEYGKLLDEAKFLTKVSDKLESKLNATNEQLRVYNEALASEAETAKVQKDKVLEKNKQLYLEKSDLDTRVNKFQLTLIILIVVLFVIIILLIYWLFFKPDVRG